MTRPDAPPELLALFDTPHALAVRARQEQWPFAGMRVERERVAELALEGGVVADTEFVVGEIAGARWTGVTFRNCTFRCDEVSGLAATRVRFEHCRFEGVRFMRGSMTSSTFAGCTFTDVRLDRTELHDLQVDGSTVSAMTVERVAADGLRIETCTVLGFSGFELDVARLSITAGSVERVRLSGGAWRDIDLDGVSMRDVELLQLVLLRIRAARCAISNCSQKEGATDDLRVDVPSMLFSMTFVGVLMSQFTLSLVPDGRFLSILRSVVRGLTFRDSVLSDTQITSTRMESPVRIARTTLDGLDLRGSDVSALAMSGGALEGRVEIDGARIEGWSLDGTTLHESMSLVGSAVLTGSDPRLSAKR